MELRHLQPKGNGSKQYRRRISKPLQEIAGKEWWHRSGNGFDGCIACVQPTRGYRRWPAAVKVRIVAECFLPVEIAAQARAAATAPATDTHIETAVAGGPRRISPR